MNSKPDGERIAVLETEMKTMTENMGKMKDQVQDMHNLFMQAKGARYVIVGAAAFAGFFAGILGKLLPLISFGRFG